MLMFQRRLENSLNQAEGAEKGKGMNWYYPKEESFRDQVPREYKENEVGLLDKIQDY